MMEERKGRVMYLLILSIKEMIKWIEEFVSD